MQKFNAVIFITVLGLSTPGLSNAATIYPDGASIVAAGNSFFAPVATSFDAVAQANGYSEHEMNVFFSGGPSGRPAQLWEDTDARRDIAGLLTTSDADVFALSGIGSLADETTIEDYQNWINLATTVNPDIHIFIGRAWPSQSPAREASQVHELVDFNSQRTFDVVEELRADNPDIEITFVSYGKTAPVMMDLFASGDLPDLDALVADPLIGIPDELALFEDIIPGHGGPMMEEIASLVWLETLYGADTGSLLFSDYQSDVEFIVDEVTAYNAQFEAPAAVPLPASFLFLLSGIAWVAGTTRWRILRERSLACA